MVFVATREQLKWLFVLCLAFSIANQKVMPLKQAIAVFLLFLTFIGK